ncbi:MAG: hypothetical protein IPK46_21940 [Saprospiraceae bacterium]|nr:hypothetical protein [Saprospiraceae bacterium]
MINVIDRIEYLLVKAGTLSIVAMGHNTATESNVGDLRRRLFNYDTNGKTITLTITGRANDANTWKMGFDGCDEGDVSEIIEYLKIGEDE